MHNYIEYFDLPIGVIIALMVIFGIMQGIGEFLEFKGQVVPEIMKVRKLIKAKREERKKEKEAYKQVPQLLMETKSLLEDVKQHYSEDNISKRNGWMNWVNHQADVYDSSIAELKSTMVKLLVDNKRNYLLDFTSRAADMSCPMSKEQYQRFYNVHKEYEEILEENGMTNGQVDVAYNVVQKSFEERLTKHLFIEDTYEFSH